MPFLKKIEVENGILGIWGLTESVDSLIAAFHFSVNEETEFKKFQLKKRQSEYLSARLLLHELLGEKTEIIYQESGRPQLKDSTQNISISHSSDLLAVFVSDYLPGIDVEIANRNIDKVVSRFLHPKELEWTEKSENRQFLRILLWCAKEAIYKCACHPGIQFDTQIFIHPFEYEKTDVFKGRTIAQNKEKNYNLSYFKFENNIVVYCVEVKN